MSLPPTFNSRCAVGRLVSDYGTELTSRAVLDSIARYHRAGGGGMKPQDSQNP